MTSSGLDEWLHTIHVRKGKWFTEEEAYAELLMAQFRGGLLLIEEGVTLRTFIAKSLQCDLMRVTKRYSGIDSMGKLVYVRKAAIRYPPPGSDDPSSDTILVAAASARERSRERFLKALQRKHQQTQLRDRSSSSSASGSGAALANLDAGAAQQQHAAASSSTMVAPAGHDASGMEPPLLTDLAPGMRVVSGSASRAARPRLLTSSTDPELFAAAAGTSNVASSWQPSLNTGTREPALDTDACSVGSCGSKKSRLSSYSADDEREHDGDDEDSMVRPTCGWASRGQIASRKSSRSRTISDLEAMQQGAESDSTYSALSVSSVLQPGELTTPTAGALSALQPPTRHAMPARVGGTQPFPWAPFVAPPAALQYGFASQFAEWSSGHVAACASANDPHSRQPQHAAPGPVPAADHDPGNSAAIVKGLGSTVDSDIITASALLTFCSTTLSHSSVHA